MPLITKPNYNQIFASQAPDIDKPPVFNNPELGWAESRQNNGKPTIKQFNYLLQMLDLKSLWILQNGACLPYDATIEYASGSLSLKDGIIQQYNGAAWAAYRNETPYTLKYFTAGASYPANAEITLTNGDKVKNVSGGPLTNNPNTDMTGWVNLSEHNSLKNRDTAGAHPASAISDASGKTQQQINNKTASIVSLLEFGADNTGLTYSNDAMRSALAYLESIGGGKLIVPSGDYKFFRELDANQPPQTAVFGANACFIAGENIYIQGEGRDTTTFIFECPGQKTGSIDISLYYNFFAHGNNFECSDLTIYGDVAESEFEFVSFWGVGNKTPGIFIHASRNGSIYGKNSKVHDCRLGYTRGLAYNTSILLGCEFYDNDLKCSNGINTSGMIIKCHNNTFYKCELLESAGVGVGSQPAVDFGFTSQAGIEFYDNVAFECYGLAVGGNTSAPDEYKTYGYKVTGNTIINNVVSAASALAVANNACDVIIDDNIIKGKFTTVLSITDGGVLNASPEDVFVLGGHYESISSGNGSAVGASVDTTSGKVYLLGGTFKSDQANAIRILSKDPTEVYIGDITLIGTYGYSVSSATTAKIFLSNGVKWIPATPAANTNQIASGVSSITNAVLKQQVLRRVTVDAVDASAVVETSKKQGGSLVDDKVAYFIRYANGRIGWGDPAVSGLADVYLERKAANVLGLDTGDCFKTGVSATASRPSAASVGQGSQYFDSTLNKPIWSDGTNWRDATGTVV